MSLEVEEDDCKDAGDISEQGRDIADQVLDNILKMSGMERSVQVRILLFTFYRRKNQYIFRPKIYSNLMEKKLLSASQTRASQSFTREVYPV